MQSNRNISPADELGHIRLEIKRLKAREAELREEILETGDATGTEFTVEIKTQERRTFDRTRLPDEILNDPENWKLSTSYIVKTIPIGDGASVGESLIDDDDG